MKQLILAAVTVAMAAINCSAEGYQVNTLSAKQMGMGHTGVAQKLGAESMIFNPAGMAYMDDAVNFSGSFTAIFADGECKLPSGQTYKTNNDPSTPLAANLGMSVNDKFKAGISFYTPYGSGINWGENWPGAVLNQSVTLKSFTVQPTLSYRIIPQLSIGVGAMVTWGTVDLNKGLVPAESFNMMLGGAWPTSDMPASINLNGKTAVAVGVNAGLMWDVSEKVTVGASYRSKMNLKMKSGTASLTYAANDLAAGALQGFLGVLNQANFQASMPAAAVLNFGVAYRPVDKLLLAFDAQWTDWSAYKSLDVEFLSEALAPFNQHIPKNYKDSWAFKLGSQYSLTDRLDLRLGLVLDTTPVRSDHYNPETPGMTKLEPSVGFSFSPVKWLSIDASLLYVAGLGHKHGTVEYEDLIAKKAGNPNYMRTFEASYHVTAINPSIGFSLHF